MNLFCWLFGHQTYNQSHRYESDGSKKKKPYYDKICFRCGNQERVFIK